MGDWTANSQKYDQSKATTFKRWLNSIAEYGGQNLGQLGRLNKIDSFGEKIPLLIFVLRGERTRHKYKILNQCLKFIPLHWKKKNGKPYEPSSFTTYLKHISAILKLESVLFSVEKEFKKKGEFHAVMNHILEKNRQEITDYGGKKKEAYMDPEADEKILKALQNGTLRPYHNYIDLVKVVLFCLARFFCLRGGNELCMALIDQFRIGRYCAGPDAGLRKIEYVNEKYKHRYLSLQRCYLSSNSYPEVREMREDSLFHPFRFITDYLNLERSSGQKRVFVRATQQTERLTEQQIRSGVRPMLTKSVYGEAKIRQFWRELVTDCKFKDAERNTPHGGRSLAATTMVSQNLPASLITQQLRHNSERTIRSYAHSHPKSNSLLQNAMDPKTIEGIPLDASDVAEEPPRDLLLKGIDPNASGNSRPNSPFLPSKSPTSEKQSEPVPPRPMSIAFEPPSTSMGKPEVDDSEKTVMLNLMKQQQEMLVLMKDEIDRLHEDKSKSWCILL